MVFQEGDIILFNTQTDHCLPSDYNGKYHVHILCHAGKAQFSMMEKRHVMEAGDWAIWQIGSDIYDTDYSSDFDADILLVERNFLIENNPEVVWATKGYVFIKENPVFRLDEKGMRLLQTDFDLIRQRLSESNIFRREILGRTLQIFLFDLWNVYEEAINRQEALSNLSASIFHRFMDLVRQYSSSERGRILCRQIVRLCKVSFRGSEKGQRQTCLLLDKWLRHAGNCISAEKTGYDSLRNLGSHGFL